MLPSVVQELKSVGLAKESEGATCVFLPGYKNREGEPLPLIISKSDGGFLYATTDLAAVKHRVSVEKANRILYVTDAGQALHFEMVFAAARAAGWVGPEVDLRHVPFGVVQGEDGAKLKSRSGDTVKLRELLSEAVRLAEADMLARKIQQSADSSNSNINSNSDSNGSGGEESEMSVSVGLTEEEQTAARIVGLGAVKYADLSMNRESDYRFSFSKMLALTGNTAPYMLYAYARVQGIRRRALEDLQQKGVVTSKETSDGFAFSPGDVELSITAQEEAALARHIIKLEEMIEDVEKNLFPNKVRGSIHTIHSSRNNTYIYNIIIILIMIIILIFTIRLCRYANICSSCHRSSINSMRNAQC